MSTRAVACLMLASATLGCFTPPASDATKKPPITDDNACVRLCDDLTGCGGAPGRCVPTCEEDRATLNHHRLLPVCGSAC